jgi:hypothetical protein
MFTPGSMRYFGNGGGGDGAKKGGYLQYNSLTLGDGYKTIINHQFKNKMKTGKSANPVKLVAQKVFHCESRTLWL